MFSRAKDVIDASYPHHFSDFSHLVLVDEVQESSAYYIFLRFLFFLRCLDIFGYVYAVESCVVKGTFLVFFENLGAELDEEPSQLLFDEGSHIEHKFALAVYFSQKCIIVDHFLWNFRIIESSSKPPSFQRF